MSGPRPESPLRRPDTARPRHEAPPAVAPPSADELLAIGRHVATRPGQDGAEVRVDDELGVVLVRGPGPGPDLTYAALPRWTAEGWSASVARLEAHMAAAGLWPSLMLFDRLDEPPGLGEQLARIDWVKVTDETIMWVGHASVVPHLDPHLRIEAVQPRSVDVHEALERHVFGLAASLAPRRREAMAAGLAAGYLRAWIVWIDDEPVAVARLTQGEGVAGIQGVGVMEARRGQGFGTLVTTIATRAGLALGNRLVWLSVDDDNAAALKVYRGLGFQRAFGCARWLSIEGPAREGRTRR